MKKVMYTVPGETNDPQQCDRLIRNRLKLENCEAVSVMRLGRRGETKTRPVIGKLGNEHQKWKITGSAKMLRDD